MRNSLLVMITLLSISIGYSQKYISGYVLKSNGDTLRVEILNQNEMNAVRKCVIKVDNETQTLMPHEIKEYKYSDGRYYVSKVIELNDKETKVFLRYLFKGSVELYSFYDTKATESFYIQKDNRLVKLENNKLFFSVDGTDYSRYDKKYISVLKTLYSDAPEVIEEIDKLGFSSKALINISEEYHNYICNDSDYEIFVGDGIKFHIGLKPFFNYEIKKLNIERNASYAAATQLSSSQNSISYNLKSNNGYSYGLALIVFSPDKKFEVGYSIYKQSNLYSNSSYPVGISIVDFNPDYEATVYDLKISSLMHQFSLSYKFGFNKIQPFLKVGALFGKNKELKLGPYEEGIYMPTSLGGLEFGAGINYNINKKLILELNMYGSSIYSTQHWIIGNGYITYNYTINAKSIEYGTQLGIKFIIF